MGEGFLYYRKLENIWVYKSSVGTTMPVCPDRRLEVKVAGEYRLCSLKYDRDWYVWFGDCCFRLKKNVIYNVRSPMNGPAYGLPIP